MPEFLRQWFCLRSVVHVLILVTTNGCATTTHGPSQRIIVSTPGAPGAKCLLKSPTLGEKHFSTPEAMEIPRSTETVEISCRKTCFIDRTVAFAPAINVEDLAANALIGGAAPLAIDLVTKRAYNYQYDLILHMKPDRRCSSGGKGFLDGDPKDFDNRIEDFSFQDPPASLPKERAGDQGLNPAPLPAGK